MTSSYGPFLSSIWFPVQSGTTSLPPAPAPIVNVNWRPCNAADIPNDWVPTDVERLFQEILPNQEAPIYRLALDVDYSIKPYKEVFVVQPTIRLRLSTDFFPYALRFPTREVVISLGMGFGEFRAFPTKVVAPLYLKTIAQKVLQPWRESRVAVKAKVTASSSGVNLPPAALLHMDGPDGSSTFIDEMGATWTSQFAELTSTDPKIGASVGAFLTPTSMVTATDPKFVIGSKDFTIDFWLKVPVYFYYRQYLISLGTDELTDRDYGLYLSYSTIYIVYRKDPSFNYTFTFGVATIPSGVAHQWNHIRVARQGSYIYGYVNHVQSTSNNVGFASIFGASTIRLCNSSQDEYFLGYMDEFRLINGVGQLNPGPTLQTEPYEPAPLFKLARLTTRTRVFAQLIVVSQVTPAALVTRLDSFFTTGSKLKPNLYAGNNSSQTVDGLGFRPSFVWVKAVASEAYGTFSFDRLRGANKALHWGASFGEDQFGSGTLTAFLQDGFTLGNSGIVNQSGTNYAAWAFGGNESRRTIAKSTVSDGFIAETRMATVEPEAISYGYYVPNDTFSLGNGKGSYVFHGFNSEPELVFVAGGAIALSLWPAVAVGQAIGEGKYASNYNERVQTTSPSNLIYKWNSSRPQYFRVGNNYDRNLEGRYTFYAFKSKAGVTSIGKYAGSNTVNRRIELGWRPAMIIIRELYSSDSYSGLYFHVFDGARSWSQGLPFRNYASTQTASITVDATGFTVPMNSPFCKSGSTHLYLAVAGSLVSPLVSP